MRRLAAAIVVLVSVAGCSESVAGEPSAKDSLNTKVFGESALEGDDGVRKS